MRRLTVQLFLPILLVVVAFFLVTVLYWSRAFEHLYIDSLTERLQREARLVADAVAWGPRGEELDRICRLRANEIGGRVTVVADDGTVLGESEEPSSAMENHGQRPEIVEARTDGLGKKTRFSHTVGYDMLYVAIADRRASDLRFVRVALPLRALGEVKRVVRTILAYGFLLAVALGGGAAFFLSRRIASRVRRIEALSREIVSGGEDTPVLDRPQDLDELGSLERRLVDVAREMHAQLAVTEGERSKLEAVLRRMADGVVVLDDEGRIVLCNRCAVEQLEITDDVMGAKLSFLCRNPDLMSLIDDVLQDRAGAVQREVVLNGRDQRRVLSVSGAPLGEEGEPHGAILVLHDMTRLRKLEEMRADFVANVSHELRTPLTAIRGYAETLLNGAIGDREKAVQFLQVIDRHSERLARLIDDLLTLSDLELGRAEIRPQPLAVAALVAPVLEVLRPKASARRIDLEADVPLDLPEILGDEDRLEQVLINLVDNAIKYSGSETRVRVRARMISTAEGEAEVELAVEDQGIGIPEQDLPRLMERFYRVDRARSRELGGTGLGLAIVKHIVQAHGGSIAIESQVNVGTTVRVTFPTVTPQDLERS